MNKQISELSKLWKECKTFLKKLTPKLKISFLLYKMSWHRSRLKSFSIMIAWTWQVRLSVKMPRSIWRVSISFTWKSTKISNRLNIAWNNSQILTIMINRKVQLTWSLRIIQSFFSVWMSRALCKKSFLINPSKSTRNKTKLTFMVFSKITNWSRRLKKN